MQGRLIRFLFVLHRWTGVILGLVMLMWCLTGFVMMYVPYPATSLDGRDFRREGLAAIVVPAAPAMPAEGAIPDEAAIASARLEMLADRLVLNLSWDDGGGLFDLSTGARLDGLNEAGALGVARTYAARHALAAEPEIVGAVERDAFIVAGYFSSGRPYWEARLNFRDECLSLEWFQSRAEAKVLIETWRRHFNEVRPHSSLGYMTPAEFAASIANQPAPVHATERSAALRGAFALRSVAPQPHQGQTQKAEQAAHSN